MEVYPNDDNKPPIGQKLNKKAIIKLYNCRPSEDDLGFENYLKELCKTRGIIHLSLK